MQKCNEKANLLEPADIDNLWVEYGLNSDDSVSDVEVPEERWQPFYLPKPNPEEYHPFEYMHQF